MFKWLSLHFYLFVAVVTLPGRSHELKCSLSVAFENTAVSSGWHVYIATIKLFEIKKKVRSHT